MSERITVVVADDHPIVLRGTCEMIEEAGDLVVLAQAEDGERALAEIAAHRPDVAILDVHMPHRDGIAVVRALRARDKSLGILILSAAGDEGAILAAMQAGADGYLLKTATDEELHRAIRLVAAGQLAILQPAVSAVLRAEGQRPLEMAEVEPLSEREREVLRTLAQDLSNKEIARRLGISDRTVQQHLANVFGKLGVASRTGAVLRALQLGYLTLEDTRQ